MLLDTYENHIECGGKSIALSPLRTKCIKHERLYRKRGTILHYITVEENIMQF